MPNLGLGRAAAKALERSIKEGAAAAKVVRPGEVVPPIRVRAGELIVEPAPPPALATPEVAPATAVEPSPAAVVEPPPAVVVEPPAAIVEPSPAAVTPAPRPEPQMTPEQLEHEAGRLSRVQLGDYALDESYQKNFDRITSAEDTKAVMADLAERNSVRIDEARRGVITDEQLRGLASDMGRPEQVVRAALSRETGTVPPPEMVLSMRQWLNASAERTLELAKSIRDGVATDLDRLNFIRQQQLHAAVDEQFMGARAEWGRIGRVLNMPLNTDPEMLRAVRETLDRVAPGEVDELARAYALVDSASGVNKLARQYNQSKLLGVATENFVNSILSGPRTHLRNIFGNMMMQPMQVVETAWAARMGRFLSGDEHVQVGEASALAHGTVSAWRDAFRLAAKAARSGQTLDDVLKFDTGRRRSISAERLLTPEQRATPLGRFAEGLLEGFRVPVGAGRSVPVPGVGPLVRAPTERMLAPADEFFRTLAYRGELERQAFLQAYDKASSGGLANMADAADLVRDFMESPPQSAVKAADEYTKYVTFQNELGPRGRAVQLAIRANPELSLIAPFIRTPANLFTASILDRTPVALFRKKFWDTMKKGGRERDMMLSRVTLGSAASGVIASYVVDGTVTGAGPLNPEARALLEASGWRPYSIRITNPSTGETSYHSYAGLAPLTLIIGATADAVETMSYINSDYDGLDDERQKANQAAAAIIIGIANNSTNQTYVKGIMDATEMMSDPGRYFGSWIKGLVIANVPFSALRSQLSQIDDPYVREAWSLLDGLKVKSGIPGWSADAPARRDIFGNARLAPAGDLIGTMSALPSVREVKDSVLDELIGLMNDTRSVPVTMPTKRINGLQLTADEYERLVLISRTRPAPNGRAFHEELQRVMRLPAYATATPDMRVAMVKSVQNAYDDIARESLEEDPVFAARLNEFRRARNRLRFGR